MSNSGQAELIIPGKICTDHACPAKVILQAINGPPKFHLLICNCCGFVAVEACMKPVLLLVMAAQILGPNTFGPGKFSGRQYAPTCDTHTYLYTPITPLAQVRALLLNVLPAPLK